MTASSPASCRNPNRISPRRGPSLRREPRPPRARPEPGGSSRRCLARAQAARRLVRSAGVFSIDPSVRQSSLMQSGRDGELKDRPGAVIPPRVGCGRVCGTLCRQRTCHPPRCFHSPHLARPQPRHQASQRAPGWRTAGAAAEADCDNAHMLLGAQTYSLHTFRRRAVIIAQVPVAITGARSHSASFIAV